VRKLYLNIVDGEDLSSPLRISFYNFVTTLSTRFGKFLMKHHQEVTMTQTRLLYAVFVTACVSFQATGCSTNRLTRSSVADASKPDEDTLHVWQVMKLKRDSEITVSYDSDSSVKGIYLGMDETQTDDYVRIYRTWRQNNPEVPFPALDDIITVRRLSPLQPNNEGRLLGFDPGVIRIQAEDDIETIRIDGVREVVNRSGKVADMKVLRTLLESRQVPFMSTMLIKTDADTLRVPLAELREIVRLSNSGNSTKGLVGAAFVMVIFTVLAFGLTGSFHIL
jgi:hypothetical protein